MADYVGAFKQGLEAAEAADRARKEVESVFAELNRQLLEATDGKIGIDRREYEIRESGWASLFSFPPKPKETYWAIVAFNPSLSKSTVKQLARWSQDRAGYPCKVLWGNTKHICEDKEALENSLAELLQDPLVGENLHILMQLMETSSEEESAQQEDATDKE